MAKKNKTAVDRSIALPMRSSSRMTWVGERGGVSSYRGLKKKIVAAATKPPRGRLK